MALAETRDEARSVRLEEILRPLFTPEQVALLKARPELMLISVLRVHDTVIEEWRKNQ